MDDALRARIGEAFAGRDRAVTLRLRPGGEAPGLLAALASAAREVVEVAGPGVVLEEAGPDGPPALPALSMAPCGAWDRVHYAAAPVGVEAAPFVEALVALGTGRRDEALAARLAALEAPAALTVLVGAGCPHCAGAVRQSIAVVASSSVVTLSVVDAAALPALAERHGVRSVPTTVLDDGLCLQGVRPASELVDALLERGGPEAEARLLKSLLESGRVPAAAARLSHGPGRAAFAGLWARSTLTDRIGLMLAAEEALAESRCRLDPLVAGLLPALSAGDAALRGDTADLLGKIAHPSAAPALEALLEDGDAEVAEVAAESLAAVRGRGEEG